MEKRHSMRRQILNGWLHAAWGLGVVAIPEQVQLDEVQRQVVRVELTQGPEHLKKGTNPEELIGAAHASCFTMALSFALSDAGYNDGELNTTAKISLEKNDDGFEITQSALSLDAEVEGITEDEFEKIAQEAKENCPVSQLLNANITLEYRLNIE